MKNTIDAMKGRKVQCTPSDAHPNTMPHGLKVALAIHQLTNAMKHVENVSSPALRSPVVPI